MKKERSQWYLIDSIKIATHCFWYIIALIRLICLFLVLSYTSVYWYNDDFLLLRKKGHEAILKKEDSTTTEFLYVRVSCNQNTRNWKSVLHVKDFFEHSRAIDSAKSGCSTPFVFVYNSIEEIRISDATQMHWSNTKNEHLVLSICYCYC